MSRSYKKHPFCSDSNTQKRYWKRVANKRIRRREDALNHRSYKKAFRSWMIHEYRFRTTLADWRLVWENSHCIHKQYSHGLTLEQWQNGDRNYSVHKNPDPEPWRQTLLTWRKAYQFK